MQKYRVALIGLNSLFGQSSSLLLKLCPNIYNLRLYDEIDTSTANDVKIINTSCKVEAYHGKAKLNEAIKGSDIVLIGDDVLSTPQTCFDVMAPKMEDYAKAISESSPNALIIVAASPINKLVPVLSELLQENGSYDCNRVMGTTASYNIRANCILASYVNTDPRTVFLPVVGGDSEHTIVPLFSQAKPHFNISEAVMKRLINDIKRGSSLIYETKGSMEALNKAHATVKFLNSVIAGLRGEPNIMNIAFTKTTQVNGSEYFALPVLLGRFGIQARYGIPRILPFENDLIRESVFGLQKDTEFAKLFCKSRDSAAETCSRNVAITFKKSKEFEQFVNGLKTNKKGSSVSEDKIVDKIKPPIPVDNGPSSSDKQFDPKAFCLRHKGDNPGNNKINPAYMKADKSFMPISLGYTLGDVKGIAQLIPKSSSAETLVCQPAVCPEIPKEREMNINNIVLLVEKIVKQTTEKMMKEKENGKEVNQSFKNEESVEAYSEKTNVKVTSEKDKHPKSGHEKYECLRKIDTLMMSSEKNKPTFKNRANFSPEMHKNETNFSDRYGIIRNKSVPIRNRMNLIKGKNTNQIESRDTTENNYDKTPLKAKYERKKLESIFRLSASSFKERFDYKSGIGKLNLSKPSQQTVTKGRQIIMNNESIVNSIQHKVTTNNGQNRETLLDMHKDSKAETRFNSKLNSQSTPYQNQKVSNIKNFTSGGKKIWGKMEINENILNRTESIKTQGNENKYFNITMNEKKPIETTIETHDSYHKTKRVSDLKSNGFKYLNSVAPAVKTYTIGENNYWKNSIINQNAPKQMENNETNNNDEGFKKGHTVPPFLSNVPSESELCLQILMDTSNDPKQNQIGYDKKNLEMLSNDSRNFGRDHLHPIHEIQMNNGLNQLGSPKNKKIVQRISKLENHTYFKNMQKTIFEKHDYKCGKTCNKNEPLIRMKAFKNTKNILLGNLNKSAKKENIFHDKLNKKTYELTGIRNLEEKNIHNNEKLKNLFNDNSYNNSKDFVRHNLRSKYSVNKLANNTFAKEEKCNLGKITPTETRLSTESKHKEKVKSVCYNAFLNKLTKMNITANKVNEVHKLGVEKNLTVPFSKEIEEPEPIKSYVDISIQDNQSSLFDSKDLNMLMKTLDSDIFKSAENINEKTNNKVGQVNEANTNHDSQEQNSIADVVHNKNSITEESNDLIKSGLEEKVDKKKDHGNSQIIDQNENQEQNELTFEDIIKEIKLALQPQNEKDKVTNTSKPNEDEQSIPNNLKDNFGINNSKNHESKMNDGIEAKSFQKTSSNNVAINYIPEKKKTQKNINVLKSSEDNKKYMNKPHQHKSSTQTTFSGSTKKTDYIKKISTISEKNVSTESSKSKENSKLLRKNTKEECFNMKTKNFKDFHIPLKSLQQRNAGSKNPLRLIKPTSPLSTFSKTFIDSEYDSLVSKKKHNFKLQGFFSGRFGQKVNEINKAEHSFSLRDKNGFNNYFLLKGLLPTIKDNKQNIENHNHCASLLKTNVCNEDPFMSIKDKQRPKFNMDCKKLAKPILENKNLYTSNDGTIGSLFLTHNSLNSPNCPVHSCKHNLNPGGGQKRSISPTNKGNMSRINEAMVNNLSRICYKVRTNGKNSSHRLNQKTHNFKLYSTSALPMKIKSPSCLCIEKRKTSKQALMSKNESTASKLPRGFIKKQRITKILEKDLKKNNQEKSRKWKNTEGPEKEAKFFVERQTSNFKERNTTLKNCNAHSHVMSRTTKIDEKFFNSRFNTSFIERYLKVPPQHTSRQELLNLKNNQKYINPSRGRRAADLYKINWSNSQNNYKKNEKNSVSFENDILGRGTCLDHVRNKLETNKALKQELSNDSKSDEHGTVLNSMEPSLAKAFLQYTNDCVKCEYPTNQKLPSIRQLHKSAFHFMSE